MQRHRLHLLRHQSGLHQRRVWRSALCEHRPLFSQRPSCKPHHRLLRTLEYSQWIKEQNCQGRLPPRHQQHHQNDHHRQSGRQKCGLDRQVSRKCAKNIHTKLRYTNSSRRELQQHSESFRIDLPRLHIGLAGWESRLLCGGLNDLQFEKGHSQLRRPHDIVSHVHLGIQTFTHLGRLVLYFQTLRTLLLADNCSSNNCEFLHALCIRILQFED